MGKNLQHLGLKPKGKSISKKDFNLMKQVFIGYDKDHDGTVTYKAKQSIPRPPHPP